MKLLKSALFVFAAALPFVASAQEGYPLAAPGAASGVRPVANRLSQS